MWFGEWHEGRIHTEFIDGKTGERTYPGGQVAPSGWFLSNIDGFLATGQVTAQFGGDDQPPASPLPSSAAFAEASQKPTTFTDAHTVPSLAYSGQQPHLVAPLLWHQTEQWTYRGVYWRLGFSPPSVSAITAGPPQSEWPAGASLIDVDFSDPPSRRATLLSGLVVGTGADSYRTFYKPPLDDEPWFAQKGEPGFTVGQSKINKVDNDAGLEILVEPWMELADLAADPAFNDAADPRMPSGAVVYDDIWPGNFGGPATTFSYDGSWGGINLTYQYPRWRFIYDVQPVASPRRVFPRDDALTGGPARVYPPPKSQQRGFRAGPGSYL